MTDVQPHGKGLAYRLLLCDECSAVWPTERDAAHGGSRLDGEPCAYRWKGKVCRGRVHPMFGGRRPPREEWASASFVEGHGEWCETLGLPPGTRDLKLVRDAYRALSKLRHPDVGGSNEAMAALNVAYSQALAELGQP